MTLLDSLVRQFGWQVSGTIHSTVDSLEQCSSISRVLSCQFVHSTGEGLKVGALALLRSGCQVSLITSEESWRFRLSVDPRFQERVLTIHITGFILVCIPA